MTAIWTSTRSRSEHWHFPPISPSPRRRLTQAFRGTQRGVRYQLRLDSDNREINTPGYDYRDLGVETARIGTDFVVEAANDPDANPILLLPTGSITATTMFNILATKILSGVSAQLTSKATIESMPG